MTAWLLIVPEKTHVCLRVRVDESEHWGLHCKAASHVSPSCEGHNGRDGVWGEGAAVGSGWKEGLRPKIRGSSSSFLGSNQA